MQFVTPLRIDLTNGRRYTPSMVEGSQRRLAAIVSADVVGYSRLMGADETGTVAALRAHREEFIDGKIAEHGGRIVKTMGDGLLLEFPSVVNATKCVVEVQEGMAQRNNEVDENQRIVFRVGVNLGDIVIDGDDILGDGVNIAARIQEIAVPGGVAISNRVYEDVRDRLDTPFDDADEQTLKNISRPIRIWRWSPLSASVPTATAPVVNEAPPALPDKPSIAVLPFDNMSGDPEQEYFADGISEDVITDLSKISGLMVIARNSSFAYKGKNADIRQVCRELGVRYILEGSVRKSGNRVRINVQLIDGSHGSHMWADRFDRDLEDIFAVQDDVTREIVSALAIELTPEVRSRIKAQTTDNIDAYDLFLQGRELMRLRTQQSVTRAYGLFEKAVELDPRFAKAHAFLAHCLIIAHLNRWQFQTKPSLELAIEKAEEAIRLDARDTDAHVALGNACLWSQEHERAITELEKALAIDPNSDTAHVMLGLARHYAGQSENALEALDAGIRLNPHYPDIHLHWAAQIYAYLGQYEKAVSRLERRIDVKPDTDISRVLLAACFGHMGRFAEAREAWSAALKANPEYSLTHKKSVLPYKHSSDFDRIFDGLCKAGIQSGDD